MGEKVIKFALLKNKAVNLFYTNCRAALAEITEISRRKLRGNIPGRPGSV